MKPIHNYTFRILQFFLILAAISVTPLYAQDSKENAEFKLAVGLYNDGMYDLALQQFKNFTESYPNTSQGIEARFYLGETEMKLQQFDEARITFQNFALSYVDHPKAPEAWINVGNAFLGLKNEHEAASAFERVKVFHPKSPLVPEALLKAGQLYRRLGDRENAKKNFRSIIQDYSTSSSVLSARLAISEMYAEEGQTDLAEREARNVSESDAPPAVRASALFSLGKLQISNSLFDDAEKTFTSILTSYKKTPSAAASQYELGLLAVGNHNYSLAIETLLKVASDESADDSLQAAALFHAGETYMNMHQYGDAQKIFEKFIAKFPQHRLAGEVFLRAGNAALLNNKPATALQYARKVLQGSSTTLRNNALILAAHAGVAGGQMSDGLKYYSSLINEFAEDEHTPFYILELARLYERQLHDYRKAIAVYDQIPQRYPRSRYIVEASIGTADCQITLGDIENGIKTLTDIQSQYPAHDQFTFVQEKIGYLKRHMLKDRDAGINKLARLMGEVLTQKSKAELSMKLGEIYFNDLKDYEPAAQQFSLAIDGGLDAQQFSEAYFQRARAFDFLSEIDSGNAQQAITYYDAFLKQFPADSRADDAAFDSYLLKCRNRTSANRMTFAKNFLAEHPTSPHREQCLFDLCMTATNDTTGMVDSLNSFIAQFPQSDHCGNILERRGELFASTHRLDSAAASWRRACEFRTITPSTVLAFTDLADLEWHRQHIPEAIALWERLTSEFFYTSAADPARQSLVEAYIANNQNGDAISLINTLMSEDSSSDYSYQLATAYEKKGDRQQATHFYNLCLSRDRKGPFAGKCFYALGALARNQGRNDLASTYFKQAAALGNSTTATSDIADLLFETEQYPEAARQYRQLALSADSAEAKQRYQARSIVATLRADKLAEAQHDIDQWNSTFGKNEQASAEFLYETGNYYYRKQDYTNAKKTFEKLADDYENTRFGPWGRYYLGKILEVNDKLSDAATTYSSVLQKYPTSDVIPRVLLSLGNMHFNAERFEDAITYYQQITASPDRAGDILSYAMNNLIEAYESTKLYDAALKTTRDYIDRFPNDENIIDKKIKLGTLYTKLGYYDQAVLYFQNLISEAGSLLEAELRYDIGEAYYDKGDYQQAILEFLKVPYLVSRQGKVNWTATSFYMAGQSYEKMSKFDAAIDMYQQIIDRPGIDATFKSAAKKEINRVKSVIKNDSK